MIKNIDVDASAAERYHNSSEVGVACEIGEAVGFEVGLGVRVEVGVAEGLGTGDGRICVCRFAGSSWVTVMSATLFAEIILFQSGEN